MVEKDSAGRYFKVVMLRDTDHFSTVKPTSKSHPSHELLVLFWQRHYGPCLAPSLKMLLDVSKETMRERNRPYFTPALLTALLYPDSLLAAAIDCTVPGFAAKILREATQYLDQTLPKANAGPFRDFDWYSRDEVRLAQTLAQRDFATLVNEAHLASALLESDSKSMTAIRARLKPHLERIKSNIDDLAGGDSETPLWPEFPDDNADAS